MATLCDHLQKLLLKHVRNGGRSKRESTAATDKRLPLEGEARPVRFLGGRYSPVTALIPHGAMHCGAECKALRYESVS